MALTNTSRRYGAVAKWLHWLIALGIFAQIPLGLAARGAPFADVAALERKVMLYSAHKTLGVALFFLALLRVAWALTQPAPGLLNAHRRAEAFLARTVHWLLYATLILVPLTGWLHHAALEGFAPIRWPFGQKLPFVPAHDPWLAHLFRSLHFAFERALAIAVILHVAGALKHAVVDRDATLRRMLPARAEPPPPPPQRGGALPLLAAACALLLAVAAGAVLWYLPGIEAAGPEGPPVFLR